MRPRPDARRTPSGGGLRKIGRACLAAVMKRGSPKKAAPRASACIPGRRRHPARPRRVPASEREPVLPRLEAAAARRHADHRVEQRMQHVALAVARALLALGPEPVRLPEVPERLDLEALARVVLAAAGPSERDPLAQPDVGLPSPRTRCCARAGGRARACGWRSGSPRAAIVVMTPRTRPTWERQRRPRRRGRTAGARRSGCG